MTRVRRSRRSPFCQLPRHRQKDAYIGIKNLIRRAAPVLGGRFYTHHLLHGDNGWLDLYFLGAKAPIFYNVTLRLATHLRRDNPTLGALASSPALCLQPAKGVPA